MTNSADTNVTVTASSGEVAAAPTKPSIVPTPAETVCWFCRSSRSPEELIQPCWCPNWVHRRCLQQWRYSSPSPRDYRQCPDCLFRYRARLGVVDSTEVPKLQKEFDTMYRQGMMALWLRMLFLALFALAVTTGFLYDADTSEKDIPVACKYSLQSVINGFNSSSATTAQWRSDFKRPDVRVWPYYVAFAAFLDSALLLLGFMVWGHTIDDTDSTRPTPGTCNFVFGCNAPCPCCDGQLHHSSSDNNGHVDGSSSGPHHGASPSFESARHPLDLLVILIVYILAMVLFSVLMVAVGVAIRKMNVLYDRYAQRVLDHCKESVGDLVVIGRDDCTTGHAEASFGQPTLRVFEVRTTTVHENSHMA